MWWSPDVTTYERCIDVLAGSTKMRQISETPYHAARADELSADITEMCEYITRQSYVMGEGASAEAPHSLVGDNTPGQRDHNIAHLLSDCSLR